MKKTLIAAAIILAALAVLLSINEINSAENGGKNSQTSINSDPDEFIIGAYSIGCASQNRLQQLGLNIWHRFLNQEEITGTGYNQTIFPRGFTANDGLFKTIGEYQSEVVPYYNEVSQLNNNYIYLTRPKIEMLTFAQRSDYHPIALNNHQPSPTGEKWWYGYNTHNAGTQVTDNGKQVIKCTAGVHDSGYVLKDLRPTWEQVKGDIPNNFFNDGQYSWYIRPKIKIPDSTAPGTRVFRVEVFKKDGVLLKNIEITRDDFGFAYSGIYIDSFGVKWNEQKIFNGNDLKGTDPANISQVDYRIFWYGNCDMWLERVRVENDWANRLLYNYYLEPTRLWLSWEVQNIAKNISKAYKFLADESEYNMYPAIGYMNHIIDSLNTDGRKISLIALNNIVYWIPEQRDFSNQIPSWTDTMQIPDIAGNFQNSGMNEVFTDMYPLYADSINNKYYNNRSFIPNTLPEHNYNVPAGRLGTGVEPETYEDNFNTNIDEIGHHYIDFCQKANYLSRIFNKPYIAAVQIHSWYNGSEDLYSLREPTNQEIEAMTGISLTYGAKGIIFHAYNSIDKTTEDGNQYTRGLVGNYTDPVTNECDGSKRLINAYGQHKWDTIVNLTAKLKILGKEIIKFDNTISKSYRLHIENERSDLYGNTFINNILTLKYGEANSQCNEDNIPGGMTFDCPEKRYLQVGIFRSKTNEPYLMLVNKRCSPLQTNGYDGRRLIRIGIPANRPEFANHDNWKIVDVYDNTTVVVFNKTQNSTVYTGWIMPGEIKLYKFVPVVTGGGTLVADEIINSNIICNGIVFNNGYNLTINAGKTITFKDGAGIEMNGGVFICGENSDNADAVTLKGEGNNNTWKGLSLNGCDSVGIYNTNITNIIANDTAKAVMLTNCYKSDFRKNTITANNNSGGIQAVFNNVSDDPIIFKIRECTFNMNSSGYSAINVTSNASVTLPLTIEWCIFNTQSDSSKAVFLENVTGGVVKNNTFTNFYSGITFLNSVIDIYGNIIFCRENSQGIQCLAGSSISLSPSSGMYLGGYNYIRNYGSSSVNIYTDNSYFGINNGENDFDLNDLDNSINFSGTLNEFPIMEVSAAKNCFHDDSVTNVNAIHNVVWASSTNSSVNFMFDPYSCELTQPGDFFVFQYDNYNDTVYKSPGGEGGGIKSIAIDLTTEELINSSKEESDINIKESIDARKALIPFNIEENNYKALRDSININLRKRNYAVVEQKAMQILSQYPDSSVSTGMISKLYVSVLNLDTNSVKTNQLKTFLENLITSNPQNTGLVKSAFYHIQKCKVKLGSYQSALDGFQYIMTQNPYSYEGLIASWDYAATYLLMGSGGMSNNDNLNFNTEEELNTPADTLINRMLKGDIYSDRNSERNKNNLNQSKQQTGISNEQSRKEFYEKIKTVNKDSKTIQEEKVKTLEKKIETSKDDKTKEDARTELTKMKQINEAVKIKKPDNIKTHTVIINNDIRKVFGIGKKPAKETSTSLLPKTFELYQNYPNPFNPATKIAFDLPRDAKVKLVIYDILGREVKTLINNEFRSAGKYVSEFNGSNLASGVYFARILVNDGKNFVGVKKMVLVK